MDTKKDALTDWVDQLFAAYQRNEVNYAQILFMKELLSRFTSIYGSEPRTAIVPYFKTEKEVLFLGWKHTPCAITLAVGPDLAWCFHYLDDLPRTANPVLVESGAGKLPDSFFTAYDVVLQFARRATAPTTPNTTN